MFISLFQIRHSLFPNSSHLLAGKTQLYTFTRLFSQQLCFFKHIPDFPFLKEKHHPHKKQSLTIMNEQGNVFLK